MLFTYVTDRGKVREKGIRTVSQWSVCRCGPEGTWSDYGSNKVFIEEKRKKTIRVNKEQILKLKDCKLATSHNQRPKSQY